MLRRETDHSPQQFACGSTVFVGEPIVLVRFFSSQNDHLSHIDDMKQRHRMSLFKPDPELPFWLHSIPTAADLAEASPEQYGLWVELNAHISYVHTAWGNLELTLGWLLAATLRIKFAQAQVILASLTSNRLKREVIQSCATVSLQSATRAKDVGRLLKRISKAASSRNFLAHGIAGYHQKYPDRITVTGMSKDLNPALSHYLAFSIEDLQQTRETLDVISGDIKHLLPTIYRAKRRALHGTSPSEWDQGAAFFNNPRQPPPEKPPSQPQTSRQSRRIKKLSSAQKRTLREKGEGP